MEEEIKSTRIIPSVQTVPWQLSYHPELRNSGGMYALVPKTRVTALARNISQCNYVKVDHIILELSTLQTAERNQGMNARTTGISAPRGSGRQARSKRKAKK